MGERLPHETSLSEQIAQVEAVLDDVQAYKKERIEPFAHILHRLIQKKENFENNKEGAEPLTDEEKDELEILKGEYERFYGEVNINAVELFKLTNQDPEAKWQKKEGVRKEIDAVRTEELTLTVGHHSFLIRINVLNSNHTYFVLSLKNVKQKFVFPFRVLIDIDLSKEPGKKLFIDPEFSRYVGDDVAKEVADQILRIAGPDYIPVG